MSVEFSLEIIRIVGYGSVGFIAGWFLAIVEKKYKKKDGVKE